MRQYPIWNDINTRGGKKSSSNFGARDGFAQDVYVGTSSRNSHLFARIDVVRGVDADGRATFILYVDDELIKYGILDGEEFSIDIDTPQEAGEAPFNDRKLGNFDGIKQAD